jgi:PAS domain S-box-containing protein
MPKARQAQRAQGEEAAGSALDAAIRLVENLPVPVFFKGRDGRYLGVNGAWEEFFGIARDAFVGKRVTDLYPHDPEVAARHARADEELYAHPAGGQSYEIPIRTGGRRRDTIYYKSTFTNAAGEVAGIVGAIVDITARKHAEEALRDNEERWRTIVNSANDGILVYDRDLKVIAGNQAAERILGVPLAELIGAAGFTSRLPTVHADGRPVSPEDRPTRMTVRSGHALTGHIVGIARPGGRHTWLSVNTALLRHPGSTDWYGVVSTFSDITDWRNAQEALQESAIRFRETFDIATSGIAHVTLDGRFQRVNRSFCRLLGYDEGELVGRSVKEISHPEDRDVTDDVTERKAAEAALRESEERYRRTFELAGSGVAHIGLDRRFVRVNARLCEILGYPEHELIGMTGRQISHPDDVDVINAQRPQLYSGAIPNVRVEKRYVRKDGSIVWVTFSMVVERDAGGRPLYEIAIFDDVTARKQADVALRDAHEELKRSNAELEQFAYVASHDLQEPLRMVSSYTQLLGKRHGDKLQGDAQEFMHYIVDGAGRMKQLIEDLLAYSRVGTRGKDFKPVPLETPLRKAVTNLRAAIEESSAAVTWDALPTLELDEMQMTQLFQNLIGNALKFRGPGVPRVHVAASEREKEWEITVSDNGIGIEPAYFERIFMVFQRLHTMGEYPGTGIGLAICKKVIERHGGRIWVSSTPGEGSAFHFTLQKKGSHD